MADYYTETVVSAAYLTGDMLWPQITVSVAIWDGSAVVGAVGIDVPVGHGYILYGTYLVDSESKLVAHYKDEWKPPRDPWRGYFADYAEYYDSMKVLGAKPVNASSNDYDYCFYICEDGVWFKKEAAVARGWTYGYEYFIEKGEVTRWVDLNGDVLRITDLSTKKTYNLVRVAVRSDPDD